MSSARWVACWPSEELAETHLALHQLDEAWRHGTMGISVGAIVYGHAQSYPGDPYADAGSVACRIVRAKVLIKRKRWDEARDEIDYASTIAEWGRYSWALEGRRGRTHGPRKGHAPLTRARGRRLGPTSAPEHEFNRSFETY